MKDYHPEVLDKLLQRLRNLENECTQQTEMLREEEEERELSILREQPVSLKEVLEETRSRRRI